MFCQFRKRRAPKNDEDPFTQVPKIMDMRPISIKTHEWFFVKYGFPENGGILINVGKPENLKDMRIAKS